jgi:hypothetical protein
LNDPGDHFEVTAVEVMPVKIPTPSIFWRKFVPYDNIARKKATKTYLTTGPVILGISFRLVE